MKFKLMLLSLCPVAIFTIINNLDKLIVFFQNFTFSNWKYINDNLFLVIVISFCCLWILCSIWFYIEFLAFQYTTINGGYSITVIQDETKESLSFLLTIIMPLVIDKITSINGCVMFFFLFAMMSLLLYKTNLFYANPILTMLGYHVYKFEFQKNAMYQNRVLIGISTLNIQKGESKRIKYMKISENEFVIG